MLSEMIMELRQGCTHLIIIRNHATVGRIGLTTHSSRIPRVKAVLVAYLLNSCISDEVHNLIVNMPARDMG